MTFVRVRLALDRLGPGKRLAVRLKGTEPLRNVPASARQLGHAVDSLVEEQDGSWTLLITTKQR